MADLRIQKNDKLISEAFVDLVIEKEFANVTVKDIATRAMINRKTFYAHYQDKFALTDVILQNILTWLDETLQKRVTLLKQEVPLSHAVTKLEDELRELMANWRRPINALMTIPEAKGQLLAGAQRTFSEQLCLFFKRPASELEKTVIGSTMLGLITYYLQSDDLPSRDEFQQLSTSLTFIFGG